MRFPLEFSLLVSSINRALSFSPLAPTGLLSSPSPDGGLRTIGLKRGSRGVQARNAMSIMMGSADLAVVSSMAHLGSQPAAMLANMQDLAMGAQTAASDHFLNSGSVHLAVKGLTGAGGLLLAFGDQGGNLAGKLFQASLPPYLAFLYFLRFMGNRTPKLAFFGFTFLLLFVAVTIPSGSMSKATWGLGLADVDWLHGSAELLLTVSNALVVLGLRNGLLNDASGPSINCYAGDDKCNSASTRYDGQSSVNSPQNNDTALRVSAMAMFALLAPVCALGVGTGALGLGPHDAFMGGAGNLGTELLAGAQTGGGGLGAMLHLPEPVNALSVPTWVVHFSTVFEFIFAMQLMWRYAQVTGNERWKGVAWGMFPSHMSSIAACTYHLFFNSKSVAFLVTLQAFLTVVGNVTLAAAAFRLAASNGWTLGELDPRNALSEDRRAALAARSVLVARNANPNVSIGGPVSVKKEDSTLSVATDTVNREAVFVSSVFDEGASAKRQKDTDAARNRERLREQDMLQERRTMLTKDIANGPALFAKVVAATLMATYVTKYGELLFDFPFDASPAAAIAVFCVPPTLVASTMVSNSPDLRIALPGVGQDMKNPLSMDDVRKYGVAGTLAYVLTEVAFWAVAFPVASYALYNAQGHWPDFGSNTDRAAVAAFVFAGSNVARLLVPLRFGAALALAPWVDDVIVSKLKGNETTCNPSDMTQ